MLSSHIKDILKVSAAASTNVVAAGASAAASPGAQQVIQQHGSFALHNVLLVCQIIVALLSGAYICYKFWRVIKDKKPID